MPIGDQTFYAQMKPYDGNTFEIEISTLDANGNQVLVDTIKNSGNPSKSEFPIYIATPETTAKPDSVNPGFTEFTNLHSFYFYPKTNTRYQAYCTGTLVYATYSNGNGHATLVRFNQKTGKFEDLMP